MRYLLLGCLSLACFWGCAKPVAKDLSCRLTSVNLIDQDGLSVTITHPERLEELGAIDFSKPQPYQKILRVYGRDLQGNVRAVITSYHPNGQIKQSLNVLNNRAFGKYREWFQSGVLKVEATIIGGVSDINTAAEKTWLFDEVCQAWGENGELVAKIAYSKGVLDGDSIYYHPNGQVWKKVPFFQGLIEGDYEVYTSLGDLLKVEHFVKGKKEGEALRFWEKGCLSSKEIYRKGLLFEGDYYDKEGCLVSKVREGAGQKAIFGKNTIAELQTFQDGVLDGEVRLFSNEGVLFCSYHIKDGLKHGLEVEYWSKRSLKGEALPKLSLQWYQGAVQGLVKTWYKNGVQESQKEMSKNVKNGHLIAWYMDGSLMLIEEYENNLLIKGEYYKKGELSPLSEVRFGKGFATLFDGEGNFIKKVEYFNNKPVL